MGNRYLVFEDDGFGVLLDPQPMLVANGFSDAAQTIPAISVNKFDAANWDNQNGPFSITFQWDGSNIDIITVGGDVVLSVVSSQLTLTDQTNTVILPMPAAPAVVSASILYEQGLEGADGIMQLMLNDVYSAETTYDNSFGTGNLVIGVTSREIKRWDSALYFSGSQSIVF
jgi:DNA-binding beta-propeller fold protein YncE